MQPLATNNSKKVLALYEALRANGSVSCGSGDFVAVQRLARRDGFRTVTSTTRNALGVIRVRVEMSDGYTAAGTER